jgi:transcriptional regulator with XRE-family HTH domain
VSTRNDIRDFLTTPRARVTPEQAGLPGGTGNRRVPGLRREEVAVLANISLEYYTRIERGTATGVSESVLESISSALQLDEAEHRHLVDLMRTANGTTPARRTKPTPQRVRAPIQRMVDDLTHTPAIVNNGRLDLLYANALGRALYAPLFADPVRPANHARFLFLDTASHDFWPDWDRAANDTVAILRTEAGANPHDRELSDLIGLLSTRSDEFAARWARHDVRLHRTGDKRIHHPEVGDLDLDYEMLALSADPGQKLLVYTAQADSPTRERLDLLASWAATPAAAAPDGPSDEPSPRRTT